MKILKAGDPKAVRYFQTTCSGCRCRFEFASDEPGVKIERNFPHYNVAFSCPGCSERQQRTLPMVALEETVLPAEWATPKPPAPESLLKLQELQPDRPGFAAGIAIPNAQLSEA